MKLEICAQGQVGESHLKDQKQILFPSLRLTAFRFLSHSLFAWAIQDANSGVKNLRDIWLCEDFQASTMSLSGLDPGKLCFRARLEDEGSMEVQKVGLNFNQAQKETVVGRQMSSLSWSSYSLHTCKEDLAQIPLTCFKVHLRPQVDLSSSVFTVWTEKMHYNLTLILLESAATTLEQKQEKTKLISG